MPLFILPFGKPITTYNVARKAITRFFIGQLTTHNTTAKRFIFTEQAQLYNSTARRYK